MFLLKRTMQLVVLIALGSIVVAAQDSKNFSKDGLSFDYAPGWSLVDNSNSDAQQLTLARANSDVQISVFVHKGRVTPEKFPEAKKAFIDPYLLSTGKQFLQMGAKPEQAPISSDIGGVKADGVKISAVLGGEPGAANIYWALLGQRVVVLTQFGPDKQLNQQAAAWDLVRTSLKIFDPKAAPSASPKP
jgi:hypothetical protein